ncbi:hypothetical protein [Ruegeria sp. A3M17]|uniref:hypothetical protein n=1 Tax=Ruegeria sp. A3M17 TaxID=2267229 RepID=UPI000DEA8136|nr:hypothetical protein [Ruegeria sp. A3M17]RBW61847.1 hypothetical protein DS906_04695 [Ruegeria sp. A3M17]
MKLNEQNRVADKRLRRIGNDKRRAFTKRLKSTARARLGRDKIDDQLALWADRQSHWASMRVRPEVVITVNTVRERMVKQLEREVSQSEALSFLVELGVVAMTNRKQTKAP